MNEKELLGIISKGECHTTEFRESKTEITKDVYESICAFSNRDGGHIFLGVKDNGEISGIEPNCIEKLKKDFVTAINNVNKICKKTGTLFWQQGISRMGNGCTFS